MAKEKIPITPEVISWARKRAGLTLAEAAEKFPHIEEWETGDSLPTYAQLERLSDEFKVPVAVFFFPEPPVSPPIRESFRTLPDVEYEQIPRRVRYLLRKAKAFQLNLLELNQGQNPSPKLITRDLLFERNSAIPGLAARVRDYLGVSMDKQFEWHGDEDALKGWREALQNAGVFVFKDAFRTDDYSGFSIYDDLFPIIYVNNSSTKTRQIFTLFHELAHLLFHTSGIDTITSDYVERLPDQQRQIEVVCNRFAAEFLVPDAMFEREVGAHDRTVETAEMLADRFSVSREVIYRKFLDRGWVNQGDYRRTVREWAAQRQPGGKGGDFYWNKIAYLGREYIALALKQYHQHRIDEGQLGEYLDTKPKNIPTLEEYFTKAGQ